MSQTVCHMNLPIAFEHADFELEARNLAKRWQTYVRFQEMAPDDEKPYLLVSDNGLSLVRSGLSLRGDFSTLIPRIKPNRLNSELIVRAARLRSHDDAQLAVDATAGLGEDAFLLAASGFEAHLYERNPVIAALLEDALDRALQDDRLAPIAKRMKAFSSDSIEALPSYQGLASIVLLDPMFPPRTKSASVKKKFQLLHDIESPCHDEDELMGAALAANPTRIIVKRPLKGPYLAGVKPHHSLSGKAIRYDCIEPASLA